MVNFAFVLVTLSISAADEIIDLNFLGLAHDGGYYYWAEPYTVANHSTWMADSMSVIGDKTLKEITLPGTHDSGSFNLTASVVPDQASDLIEELIKISEEIDVPTAYFITVWALAQDQDFYSQLVGGIRYIDLRCGWDDSTNQWRTFHLEYGYPLEDLLSDVARFMDEYPFEVIVIEASHLDGNPSKTNDTELAELLLKHLKYFMYPRSDELDLTLYEMVQSNKRAVVTFDNDIYKQYPQLWPGDTIYNTYANECQRDDMESYNEDKLKKFADGDWDGQLFKMSWTLTPDTSCVIDSIIPGYPDSLREAAVKANDELDDWYDDHQKQMGNILIIDHFEKSPIIDVVKKMNGIQIEKREEQVLI